MTEPEPEPRGQRRNTPPRPPVAAGLLDPGRTGGSFPWLKVAIACGRLREGA